jgi:hypothetical protein
MTTFIHSTIFGKNRKNSLEVTTRVSESFETDKEIGPAVL